MYQGKLTPGEKRKLVKAKEIIDTWLRYQRENPATYQPAVTYIAADAAKALESFLATQQ